MTKQEIIDLCGKTAKEAQIRDDVCSRSTLIGLKAYFDIPEDVIRASSNLCGGAGASSGSCGTYTCGQLAVGLKYNHTAEEELENPALFDVTSQKFMELRDHFLKEPEISIRYMTSKWGVCYPQKAKIVLSTRLIHYPVECMEYVLLHEYVHFLVPNHSRTFYDTVRRHMPDYAFRKKLLK